ncbi:MAG: outer membrane beta-barrel protein [Elusimicrobiaceae bacterium]|nr:outer membrane beta-barrel protein [Elusimicrobiaceae bacterium]
MKKLITAVLAVLLVSPAFANNWGLGLRGGFGEDDPKSLKEEHDMYGGELTQAGYAFMGIEGLYEFDLNDTANKLGVKVGLDIFGENELDSTTETTVAVPLTVYYKRDGGVKGWSYYVGGGMTYIETDIEAPGFKDSKDKFFPHAVIGAEYRFCRLFALGLEGKYNFNAKLEKGTAVYSDHSGLSGAIVAKFYF